MNYRAAENLEVLELFAGVGGFRLGLCGTKDAPLEGYSIKWANQWEPTAKKWQHAALVYANKFHGTHLGADLREEPYKLFAENIFKVPLETIPRHHLLTGGFPCQDYSVARALSQAAGIRGKKGVLWWAIRDIVENKQPNYLMLENVDRLLKSPAKQRGRDFGIMLSSLAKLNYIVEWRVVNAAEYGMPQRRKRTFILAYHSESPLGKIAKSIDMEEWIAASGIAASAFPLQSIGDSKEKSLFASLPHMTRHFGFEFENAGLMRDYKVITARVKAPPPPRDRKTLSSVLLGPEEITAGYPEYWIPHKELAEWKRLKGAKNDVRVSKSGFKYTYSEGSMAFPDLPENPSRTIVTGEGGKSPSRFKHVIRQGGRYRRLTPIELEKLCMFPPDHTKLEGISDQKRAFFMGNALVVGVVERLGRALLAAHRQALQRPAKQPSGRRA